MVANFVADTFLANPPPPKDNVDADSAGAAGESGYATGAVAAKMPLVEDALPATPPVWNIPERVPKLSTSGYGCGR